MYIIFLQKGWRWRTRGKRSCRPPWSAASGATQSAQTCRIGWSADKGQYFPNSEGSRTKRNLKRIYHPSGFYKVPYSKQIGKLFKRGGRKGRKRGKKEEKERERGQVILTAPLSIWDYRQDPFHFKSESWKNTFKLLIQQKLSQEDLILIIQVLGYTYPHGPLQQLWYSTGTAGRSTCRASSPRRTIS